MKYFVYGLIIYVLSIFVSKFLFRMYFKHINKEDTMYSAAYVMMFIPFMNVFQPIGLIMVVGMQNIWKKCVKPKNYEEYFKGKKNAQ